MVEIRFEFEKETKNTYRFKETLIEDKDEAVVGTIYVQKHVFDNKPKFIKITLEEE